MPALLFCIILFVTLLHFRLKRIQQAEQADQEEYLSLERKAAMPIKRNLNDLPYVTIPLEQLPFSKLKTKAGEEYEATLQQLAKEKLCNLASSSATDLKLKYGAKNFSLLTRYEENYQLYVVTLANWCEALFQDGQWEAALQVGSCALACQSDVSKTYRIMAQIYLQEDDYDALHHLADTVAGIPSPLDLKKTVYDVLNQTGI